MLLDLQRPVILKKIEMSYRFERIRFKYVRTTILVLVNAAKNETELSNLPDLSGTAQCNVPVYSQINHQKWSNNNGDLKIEVGIRKLNFAK